VLQSRLAFVIAINDSVFLYRRFNPKQFTREKRKCISFMSLL